MEVLVGSFGRAEEATLAGQQRGQLDPSHFEEEDDDKIEHYKSSNDDSRSSCGNSRNFWNEKVTVGFEEGDGRS